MWLSGMYTCHENRDVNSEGWFFHKNKVFFTFEMIAVKYCTMLAIHQYKRGLRGISIGSCTFSVRARVRLRVRVQYVSWDASN